VSLTATVTVESPDGHSLSVPCADCNGVKSHDILAVVKTIDSSPGDEVTVWKNFFTVQCGGCKTVSFCETSQFSEDLEYDHEGTQRLATTTTLYPSRISGRPELDSLWSLPQGVYRIYKETHAALCGNLPVLAGVGIRAIVEAVCKEKAAAGDNLYTRINALVSMGVVTADGAKILHCLRFMGNDAAHEVKAHTEKELSNAFEVIEHLIKGVYILPKIAADLPSSSAS